MEFRAGIFNLFNRANFALPTPQLFDPATFGYRADAGRITSTRTSSRQVQFALRFVF